MSLEPKKLTPERKKQLLSLMRKAYILAPSAEFLSLDQLFFLEGIDEKHRNKESLNIKYAEWKALPKSPENNSFWSWLELRYPEFSEEQSVVYLDEENRKEYKLHTRDDVIYQGKSRKPFDTTEFTGKFPGYAAYVMDKKGQIYIGEHKSGVFHHSSFLAGAQVISAGMIKVKEGKIIDINHLSGHYLPKKENLDNFLLRVAPNVFDPNAKINYLSGRRSEIIKEFANLLIGIRKNPDYSWLPEKILVSLTKLGHYLMRVNSIAGSYSPTYFYSNKPQNYNVDSKTNDTDLTEDDNDCKNQY